MEQDIKSIDALAGKDSVNNIFDTVFRTIIEYFPQLILPVINEVFKKHYSMDESLTVLKNEHVTWGGKMVTDLFFEIREQYFHVECQSVTDGKMIIRIMEYATAIAIEHAIENEDGSFRMKFPSSCVIYLRSTKNTPDKMLMHVDFPNGESVIFDVPLLKVQEYTKDELFQKNLLILLPYYLMRYEKECKKARKMENQEEIDGKLKTFMEEFENIINRLSEICVEKEQQYLFQTLADLIIEIAMYLVPEQEKGRIGAMGGTIIKTRAQIILEQGIEKGEMKKAKETAASLAERGFAPTEIADIIKVNKDIVIQWFRTDTDLIK